MTSKKGNFGSDMEQTEPLVLCWWDGKVDTSTLESFTVSQKTKYTLARDPTTPLRGVYLRKRKTYVRTKLVHERYSGFIWNAQNQKQSKCFLSGRRIDRGTSTHRTATQQWEGTNHLTHNQVPCAQRETQNHILGTALWPVVRTLCFHCRGPALDPWSGNWNPASLLRGR